MATTINNSKNNTVIRTRHRLLVTAVSACFAASSYALPTAPTVVNGSASFNQVGSTLNITNSNGTIINWNTFSIGNGETTRFIQASSSSSVLNRVLANDPSVILGTLTSNGKVFLINPNGIMVGAGARIDVAGFIASTLNITDANFLANKLQFDATPGAGSVINQGTITTPSGGSVYLIAPNVTNSGIITTPNGETLLAAGQTVTLLDTGTPGVGVEITGTEGNATNLGTIVAEAGRIGIAGVIVKNSGMLNASSVVKEGGKVFLKASQDAYVDGNGRIVTTGTKGGKVEVLGNRVAVMDNAEIDASGTNGGGEVLIGGDYQGKNPNIQNATITYFGPNARIKANATDNGNGGKVIVWADDTTRAYGTIEAKGGPNGGNGGFVETSGHRYLDFGAHVNTLAPKGNTGKLLLDPNNLTIVASGASNTSISGGYGGYVFSAYGGTGSTIGWDAIVNQLSTTDVYVTTSDDITITASQTYNSSRGLFLDAGRNINATNVAVHNQGSGSINLLAGWDGNFGGYGGLPNQYVISGTGNVVLTNSSFQSDNGSIYIRAGGSVALDANSSLTTSNNGIIEVYADRDIAINGNIHGGGYVGIGAGYMGPYGGNIFMGSNARVVSDNNDVELDASRGNLSQGNITLGYIGANNGYAYVYADGAILDGNGAALNISTGSGIGLQSHYGGSIGQLAISADTKITNAGYVHAYVDSSAQYGGISIRNQGVLQTGYCYGNCAAVQINDYSTYGGGITFTNIGDVHTAQLALGSYGGGINDITVKSLSGTLYVDGGNVSMGNYNGTGSKASTFSMDAVGGNMIVTDSPSISTSNYGGTPFDLNLHAAGDISITQATVQAYDIGISADSLTMSNGGELHADNNLNVFTAGNINLSEGYAYAGNAVTVFAGGKLALDNNSGIFGYGPGILPLGGDRKYSVSIAASDVSLDHGSYIEGGYQIDPTGNSGNIQILVSGGDITLDHQSGILAGNDVMLTLTGSTSKVSLNDHSIVVSDLSTAILGDTNTTDIRFLTRSSGGIFINGVQTTTSTPGNSGFFVGNFSTPATPGHGLNVVYGSPDNIAAKTIDQFFANLTDDKKKTDTTIEKGKDQNGQEQSDVGQCT